MERTESTRNNKFFQRVRIGIFCLLIVLEGVILFQNIRWELVFGAVPSWLLVLVIELIFTFSNFLKTFVLEEFRHKITCYVIDFLSQLALTLIVNSTYLSAVYLLMLSEFYMSTERLSDCIGMGSASLFCFVATRGIAAYYFMRAGILETVFACLSEIFILIFHFLLVNFALHVYDSRQRMAKSLQELDESNRKLKEAYDELAEVTALQERQRIAREIHDTAGHSITTVIMQTEAAKLIVERDPEEAKRRIIAANLQAKNALEELRQSVHVLAGEAAEESLKDSFDRVIRESTDGTDVVIRSDVADIVCSSEKKRFLTNTLKEGIANGLRHGHATAFYVELCERDGQISFLLSDNGAGSDVEKMKSGFGLSGMYGGTERFGGKMEISSASGEGLEIRISIPAEGRRATEAESPDRAAGATDGQTPPAAAEGAKATAARANDGENPRNLSAEGAKEESEKTGGERA